MKDRAFAKINLCLDVVRKREDGYHELKMIMVPIDFYDVLEMNFAQETSMKLNRAYLPVNEKNTVIKAIQVMKDTYHLEENFACVLQKTIPTQAGLAGGSADAAAAIRLINRMCRLHLNDETMIELGRQVGADVPFCLINRPALVGGIGEEISTFECHPDFELLLVKPRRGVSTKAAFGALDFDHIEHPDCEAMRTALINQDYGGVIHSLGNSLEAVSLKLVPEIRQVKQELVELGFDGVLMSGSGSTVFGITKDRSLVTHGAEVMKHQGNFVRTTRIMR
ncbi:MAG: 4-(cytidine 5'-diphospho)-2-C-methyl-D-erythritol kinase [Solobacterium sp.]|jgi:4-diphosphocytidyl-2-C-methyl-D-erythritol kinase|nr:4-(cytidine 5'-diphospho)-2-C-methyl-D-erythritol kinase [Solobacterium sp.]MCH4223216.1 4-(cytidine 5'-diphospho)-2-C-methyl-D-erythritol kinase [Solobacterium sp.]MCH4266444.1 4-(cytidine 5'-diphospho)-2-C-methyl-D-erythritol kinase [Solobacterium sp.]